LISDSDGEQLVQSFNIPAVKDRNPVKKISSKKFGHLSFEKSQSSVLEKAGSKALSSRPCQNPSSSERKVEKF